MIPTQASLGARIPWLPDETLFSWCSRYHHLAVNGLASATCLQLFGGRRRGVAHDFPDAIGALAQRADGLGPAEQIVHERTLLAFYAPFRGRDLLELATAQLIEGRVGHLKYQLGMLTSGLGAAHPLKACPACMTSDRRQFGVAYWRRAHQLPSSWYCVDHGDPLLVSPLKLDQRARFQWALPGGAGLRPWASAEAADSHRDIGRRMAVVGLGLCGLPAGRLASSRSIARAFHSGLRRREVLWPSGRVSWLALDPDLRRHAAALNHLPPFALQMDALVARSQLGCILSGRALTHPLRYVAWICMGFDCLDEFVEAYDNPAPIVGKTSSTQAVSFADEDDRAAAAVLALLDGKESLTSVAHRLDVHPTTVAAWSAKAGLQPARRPKKLVEAHWLSAIAMLSDGRAKADVARQIGVAEVTVTRILRSVPGLQVRWHEVRHEAARAQARRAWLEVAAAAAMLGRAAARRAEPAAFAWLYRNDRVWLQQQSQRFSGARSGNGAVLRQRRADERYARGLGAAFSASKSFALGASLRASDWAISAPGLRKVLREPECWPLTMKVLRLMLLGDSHLVESPSLWEVDL
ncbi:TnsD family Tn7-like transposition protein [Pelomonas cellulosilytica]|uniref:TnsD family transposase n=1 Tax=Pelomonas cellulosilytica TaxID=2906762 RepID=A0ABS8XRD1_9BURK|nr:TnsD family Tn7-like transposition protein [Pelomonas sp. P8]MCE4554242.1 TnsD family transposase [Pelomonas sp. P8]